MKTTIRKRKLAEGFTLVEVMIVVFILALTGLIFAATVPTSQISRIKAAHMTHAINLAQQTIEEKKSAGYAGMLAGTTEESVPAALPGGLQTTTITQYSPNVKEVRVTIVWSGYRQVGGTVVLSTLVSDHS